MTLTLVKYMTQGISQCLQNCWHKRKFISTKKKEYQFPRVVQMAIERIFGQEPPKIFKVAFDEIKTKVISARISKVDLRGSLFVNKRKKMKK